MTIYSLETIIKQMKSESPESYPVMKELLRRVKAVEVVEIKNMKQIIKMDKTLTLEKFLKKLK